MTLLFTFIYIFDLSFCEKSFWKSVFWSECEVIGSFYVNLLTTKKEFKAQ